MDSHDIVATVTVIAGTVLGVIQLWRNGDGVVLTAMIGLYGTILGYAFGQHQAQATATKS